MAAVAATLFELSHGWRALRSVSQPVLGALFAAAGFPAPRVLVIGLVAATAGMLSVYATNDILDLAVDREAEKLSSVPSRGVGVAGDPAALRRPLARGLLSERVALLWVASTGVLAFGCAYALRPGCALILAACFALETLYCALKRVTWLKTIPAGLLIGLGGLAGWYAVRDLDVGALAFFLLLVCWEIFGRNLSNDLADLAVDAPLGIRTLATTHGPRSSARACFAGSVVVLALAALQPVSMLLRGLLVGAAAWAVVWPALDLARNPVEVLAQRYFDRASLFPLIAVILASAVFLMRGAL